MAAREAGAPITAQPKVFAQLAAQQQIRLLSSDQRATLNKLAAITTAALR